ncbi:RNA-directed DNA polymerase from transposon X-element, partial [Paramuricea clavata]
MGYITNGDCQSILNDTLNLELENSTILVGSIDVKPLTVVLCRFTKSKWCQSDNSIVEVRGWRYVHDSLNNGGKMHSLASIENITSWFSYKWIPYNSIVSRTGVCMKFQFKMTGNNNTLSLSVQTFSGNTTLIWSLHGNHDNIWKTGVITYRPNEILALIFDGKISEPNTIVAIANVSVTTETCMGHGTAVYPYFADPDYKCASDRYLCDNGECISRSLVCDGDKGCSDNSDETYCQCLTDQFRCERSGECVNTRLLCNGFANCEDASDEQSCFQETFDALNQLNSRKSPGLDGISVKLLKDTSDVIAQPLANIFNLSLQTAIFPDEWKIANVSPVFKEGNKTDCGNYRPISVISVVAKLFEGLVYNQLRTFIADNSILVEQQSGFRLQHSTETALLGSTNEWLYNMDNGLINGVLFLDLKKAFDTVDHEILLKKLHLYGIKGTTYAWFESYIQNRKSICLMKGKKSHAREIRCG